MARTTGPLVLVFSVVVIWQGKYGGGAAYRILPMCRSTVVVVGGGAAGYFGAVECATASRGSLQVVIFEAAGLPLQKVKISGGGRCNVLHDESKLVKVITAGYPRGSKQLLGPMSSQFGPEQTAQWFRQRGVVLKTEADGRMFPVTDSSETIINCLQDAARRSGVRVITGARVTGVNEAPGTGLSVDVTGRGASLQELRPLGLEQPVTAGTREGFRLPCQYVLLASGSAREGWRWAEGLGHRISPPVPSLFTFSIKDPRLEGLAGVSVQDASVSLRTEAAAEASPTSKKKRGRGGPLTQRGPVLITHSGISGPAPLKLSAFAARELSETAYRGTLVVNWCGEAARTEVMQELRRVREHSPKKTVQTVCPLPWDVPKRLWQTLAEHAGVGREAKWGEVSNAQLERLANNLAACELSITGKGAFKDEFVTCGGVSLDEVNMKTMESKKVPGLHFAGEVLDIDGITGGYNFQSAWTTGWIAGHSIADAARTDATEEQTTAMHLE